MLTDLRALFFALVASVMTLAGYQVIAPKPTAPTPPPTTSPAPKPEDKPEPKPDAPAARVTITFNGKFCSGSVIDAKQKDGRHWVLTAAHCLDAVGQRGVMRIEDGRRVDVTVKSIDRRADCAWLITDPTADALPFALVAETDPPPGARVWHAGYGEDSPGNRESGTVVASSNADGQLQFRLSVSSGDSGGGICLDDSGRVVGCVCCTTAKGQVADVWGAGPAAIRRAKPTTRVHDDFPPMPIPIKQPVPSAMPSAK